MPELGSIETAKLELEFKLTHSLPSHTSNNMQTGKRLADIAAPAVEAAPVEQPQVKKESAKQRARIEQGLAEIRVESIRVDGLVSSRSCYMYRNSLSTRWATEELSEGC